MRSETYLWKQQHPIAEDYTTDFDSVQELFEYNPWEAGALDQRAKWLDETGHLKVNRSELVKVLTEYNERMKNQPEALENIAELENQETLAVVGGQQAGLFTGPLLVIYKAITLIQTAKEAARHLQRRVVPIFWIAGEDHDVDEVNHTYYLSPQLNIEKIKLNHADHKSSVSHLKIGMDDWEQALGQLDSALIDTEFKPDLMARLDGIARDSSTLVDFFAQVMSWLFGRHGLIVMDSGDKGLRQIEGRLFNELIKQHQAVNQSLVEGQSKVIGLGYKPQAEVRADQVNIFVINEGQRVLLKHNGEGFTDRKEELFFSEAELLETARSHPELLSNNVFTRPLMQEYLFPVLTTVLGPGEIAYWGLLKGAFQTLGMKMPVITPRREITLLEGTLQKHMQKYGLSFDEVVHDFAAKRKAWLDNQDNLEIEHQFKEAKQKFTEIYAPIMNLVAEINPGLRKLGETNELKIMEQIEFLQARATDAFQSQYDASLRQLERIHLSILPLGKPQERVYNIFVYLNKYGTAWLDDIILDSKVEHKVHTIYYY
jgi:bacillithiol biosynthesis cysteine-adding enzyme BshC